MVAAATLIHDATIFLRDLLEGVTDPITSTRTSSNSKSVFVMTSYPDRPVLYPIITVMCNNSVGERLGMNTEEMIFNLSFEIRVWARNEKEKDQLSDGVINQLRTTQQDSSTGTIANSLYNMRITSAVNVDEEGESGIKSKIIGLNLNFYTT